jgi:hypothetical protein
MTVMVLTDSQSNLASLQTAVSRDAIQDSLRRKLGLLQAESGTSVNFRYVPAHKNYAGNELADQVAGEVGARVEEFTARSEREIPYKAVKGMLNCDARESLKSRIRDGWTYTVDNLFRTGHFQKNPLLKRCKKKTIREEERIFADFRFGICPGADTPRRYKKVCICGARSTAAHMIFHCPSHAESAKVFRERYEVEKARRSIDEVADFFQGELPKWGDPLLLQHMPGAFMSAFGGADDEEETPEDQ